MARHRYAHDEQYRVWAEEIIAALSEYLSVETYDEVVQLHRIIEGEVKKIADMFLDTPGAGGGE